MQYHIVCIDFGYPPTLVGVLLAYSLSLPLPRCIIEVPAVDLLFRGLRLIREGIEFVNFTQLTGPCLYAIVNIPSLLLIGEAETDKGEIAAT